MSLFIIKLDAWDTDAGQGLQGTEASVPCPIVDRWPAEKARCALQELLQHL